MIHEQHYIRTVARLKNTLNTGNFNQVCAVLNELRGMDSMAFSISGPETKYHKELEALSALAHKRLDEL